jgi:hypothetical protein
MKGVYLLGFDKSEETKKAEKLSQYSGPKSTYEKQPFGRACKLTQTQCQ